MRARYVIAGAALLLLGGAAAGVLDDRRPVNDAQQVERGAALYARACASCHGRNLEGQPDWRRPLPDGGLPAPPHDESGHTWHHPDEVLFRITKFGGAAEAPPGFKSNMPAFAGVLSDDEIRAVLAYIKRSWPEPIRARQAEISRRSRSP
jgi:mono/diheme cytochrome c family protein